MYAFTSDSERNIYSIVDDQRNIVLTTFLMQGARSSDEDASITGLVPKLDNRDAWVKLLPDLECVIAC
jgi:hypothetical protein